MGPLWLRRRLPGWRADGVEALLADGRRADTRTLVVCLGDSITQGQVSANYVRLLAERLGPRGFQFVNAGVNGELAYNVAERLDSVIACRPDVVTLLVGTNDVNARFDDAAVARYRRGQRLPEAPSLALYGVSLERIFSRLRAETDARVVALDLPMVGEDLSSRINGILQDYRTVLAGVSARHRVPLLPLYERLCALLPPDHSPPPYGGDLGLIVQAAARAKLLGQSWDDIARSNGLVVLTDHLHLSDRAAEVVASLIAEALEG